MKIFDYKMNIVLGVLSFLILGLFAYVAIYSYPQVDDYWYVGRSLDVGPWRSIVVEYMTWTGRYTSTFLLSISPLAWGKIGDYRLIPAILIGLSLLANFSLFRVLFRHSNSELLTWSFITTSLFITGLPALSQNLYWWAGSSTYTVPTCLLTFLLSTYFSQLNKTFKMTIGACLIFLIVGCNETSMVLLVYLSACALFMDYIHENKMKKEHIFYFFWSLFWGIVVLKAPGNSARAHEFEKSHQIFRTLGNSFIYSFVYPFKYLSIPILVTIPFWVPRWKGHAWVQYIDNNKKWFIMMLLGFFFITFAPSLWGMGRKPNERTMAVIFHGYLIVLFPFLAVFLKEKWWKRIPTFVTVIGFSLSIHTIELAKDFVYGKFDYYDSRWKTIILNKAENIPPLNRDLFSETLYFNDVGPVQKAFQDFLVLRPDFFSNEGNNHDN